LEREEFEETKGAIMRDVFFEFIRVETGKKKGGGIMAYGPFSVYQQCHFQLSLIFLSLFIKSFHPCGMSLRNIFLLQKDTKLQDFQYKLIHRILITNSFLYKCGLKETELCTFCTETKESRVPFQY
jgi:hypothetical protein